MKTRPALALFLTLLVALVVLAACGTAASPAGSAPVAGGGGSEAPSAPSAPAASDPDEPGASLDLPDIETDFPPACEIVTASDLEPMVGNDLADGVGFTSLICDWESSAEETSVALLLQPVPAEFCPDGLPEGEATDRFGGSGSIGYSDAGNIPGAQAGVCTDLGLVLVTITGGYGAESDENRYSGYAVDVMELVLSRL